MTEKITKRNRRNKIKGRKFQGEIAKDFRELYPGSHNTGVRQEKGQCDVEKTPFWIECKTGKKPNILGAYRQAINDSEEEAFQDCVFPREILVITHHERAINNESVNLVTMNYEFFMKILNSAETLIKMSGGRE